MFIIFFCADLREEIGIGLSFFFTKFQGIHALLKKLVSFRILPPFEWFWRLNYGKKKLYGVSCIYFFLNHNISDTVK